MSTIGSGRGLGKRQKSAGLTRCCPAPPSGMSHFACGTGQPLVPDGTKEARQDWLIDLSKV